MHFTGVAGGREAASSDRAGGESWHPYIFIQLVRTQSKLTRTTPREPTGGKLNPLAGTTLVEPAGEGLCNPKRTLRHDVGEINGESNSRTMRRDKTGGAGGGETNPRTFARRYRWSGGGPNLRVSRSRHHRQK